MMTLLLSVALANPSSHIHTEPSHVSPDGRMVRIVLLEPHGTSCAVEHRLLESEELVGPALFVQNCEPGPNGLPDLLAEEANLPWIALEEVDFDELSLRLVWFEEQVSPGHTRGGSLLISAAAPAVAESSHPASPSSIEE